MAEANLQQQFVAAMRRCAATVNLITTREADSRHAMAATAVVSLTADPPALLVCVNRSTSLHGPITRVREFCVNVLERRQQPLFQDLIDRVGPERFQGGDWLDGDGPNFVPYLPGAVANLFCRVDGQFDYGSHTVFVGRVHEARLAEAGAALLYQQGGSGYFQPSVLDSSDAWRVGQVIYGVSDLQRSIDFYEGSFGMRVQSRDADAWATLEIGGFKVSLDAAPRKSRMPIRLSFKTTQDLSGWAARFRAAGIAVGEIQEGRHEWMMEVTDPDGNVTLAYAPRSP